MIEGLGRKVAVLGLRDTGVESAIFLKQKGFEVFASDFSASEDSIARVKLLLSGGIQAEYGTHSVEKIAQADWILISPGISPAAPIYQTLLKANKKIYSEIEVASRFSKAKKIIAVTGSCGKTTTATLISKVSRANGEKTVLCGNIGNTWISEIEKIDSGTIVVLELSSFQLAHCEKFAPNVGVLLNIFPNHLDWHKDMNEYAAAKLKMFQAMGAEDVMICRYEDKEKFFPNLKTFAKRVYFDKVEANNSNEAAVLCAVDALGFSKSSVQKTAADFQGLEHRMEKFAEANGVLFINDSKSTTTASLAWALEKYADKSVVLLAGGKNKTGVDDFKSLKDLVRQKTKVAILIGKARQVLKEAWAEIPNLVEADTFEQACEMSVRLAENGNVVLLSPACASFDMFKNYQERGSIFKEKIKQILDSRKG